MKKPSTTPPNAVTIQPKPQPKDALVDPQSKSEPCGQDPGSTSIILCFPAGLQVEDTAEQQSQKLAHTRAPAGASGRRTQRPRHRMTSDKLEKLDAFFRSNTHPSRREKETICEELDMDLKTVTIWFQNKRQTVARSRKQLGSRVASAAAIDVLASASAMMSPVHSDTALSPATPAAELCPSAVVSPAISPSPIQPPFPFLEASSYTPAQIARVFPLNPAHIFPPRIPLSAIVPSSNVPISPERPPSVHTAACLAPYRPRIYAEDLWKHIPSSPAQPAFSSPDVSPDLSMACPGKGIVLQRPRTLEWACARSANRRRTQETTQDLGNETTDSEHSPERTGTGASLSNSETSVPLEHYYDQYPSDVVHGAVLLLELRSTGRQPSV
ncbi:hypothetical protein BC834DRAFT_965446 [Gloeopeniophorella convolvens]|nr:hypothetical protein BC834DRAFT_965446 [Gloeopeniophorella convolvens]